MRAINGKLVVDFDPTIPPDGKTEHIYPAWWTPAYRTDDVFKMQTVEDVEVNMLEAMTQQTGLVFRRDWLDRDLPTYGIPENQGW